MDGTCSGGRSKGLCGPLDWWDLFAIIASTYGWTHKEILDLTVRQFMGYIGQVPKLEARQQIRNIETTSYPNMDKQARRKVDQYYSRILRPLTQIDINATWSMLRSKKGDKRGRRTGNRKTST